MRRLEVDERLAGEWPTVKMMHGYFGTCVSGQKAFSFPRVQACARHCGPACLGLYLPRRCGYRHPVAMMSQVRVGRAAASAVRSLRSRSWLRASTCGGSIWPMAFGPDRERTRSRLFAATTVSSTAGDPIDVIFLGRLTRLKGCDAWSRGIRRASDRLGGR